MSNAMISLGIVIVSWNTRDLLRHCLQSIHASLADSDIDYTIVVVDNASSDGTPEMLRAEHPEVRLLEPGRNLGFAGGNNLALRMLLEQPAVCQDGVGSPGSPTSREATSQPPDYVLLLNPDTEVVGDAIPRLVRFIEEHRDVAVVGPRLRYPDGSPQPSRRRFPTKGTFFWESTPLEIHWPDNPWARRYRFADTPDEAVQDVDWLVGAALLVRRPVIERAGLLDASFAMYSEELEWQQRIRGVAQDKPSSNRESLAGRRRIVYVPDAEIIHHEGKSSEQALARRYLNFQHSRLRHARMLYGGRFAATLLLFLRAAYLFELAVEGAKWLLGHKRPLRAQRVALYWQVVRELAAPRSTGTAN